MLTGSIPTELHALKFLALQLGNNNLCYQVAYSSWSANSDYQSSMACQNCVNPCQNGGTCAAGDLSMYCECTPEYTGTSCTQQSTDNCGLGNALVQGTNNSCSPCVPGTFSPQGLTCIPCQVGTFSVVPQAPSASYCQPCPAGQYNSALGSTICVQCAGGCPMIGSMISSPSPSTEVPFNMTEYDQEGNTISEPSSFDIGFVYIGIFGGYVLVSGIFVYLFKDRQRIEEQVPKFAGVLRTPLKIMQVDLDTGKVGENPSMVRGVIGIWVLGGVLLVTVYQFNNFFAHSRTELTAVQPGTVFTSGKSVSATSTPFSVTLEFLHSPINCDPTQFRLVFSTVDSTPPVISNLPLSCVPSSSSSVILTYTSPGPLSFTSTSSIVFTATALNGSPLFSHGVSFNLTFTSYEGITVRMYELLTHDPGQLTGNVTVGLAAIPTEYLVDTETQSVGYTFTYFSSSADFLAVSTSPVLQVVFEVPVQGYFYQIKNIQAISDLVFVTGLLALPAGVITGGAFLATLWTFFRGLDRRILLRDQHLPANMVPLI